MKTIAELEKLMEEAIEYWKDKDKYKADFLQCLLEISKNNNINGHKYVYAILESYGRDEAGYDFAEVKLYIKYNWTVLNSTEQ